MKYQVSFRAKTWYLHMWKYHLCHGYIINHAFHTKKLLKCNDLVFHWCLYNKKNITWPLGGTKFLFLCGKNISLIRCAHSKRNFVSPRGHVISAIFVIAEKYTLKSDCDNIHMKILLNNLNTFLLLNKLREFD